VHRGGSLKEFVMRLVVASNLPETGVYDYLAHRRDQVASSRPRVEQALVAMGDDGDLGQYLTLDYGLALAEAELAWLDRTLGRLAERTETVEELPA
jgi:hypothetical protein